MRYLGYHRERGAAGTSPTLPPLARLRRWGCSMVASGVEILWMMDHRASSRPFSMREISAWGCRFASPARTLSIRRWEHYRIRSLLYAGKAQLTSPRRTHPTVKSEEPAVFALLVPTATGRTDRALTPSTVESDIG